MNRPRRLGYQILTSRCSHIAPSSSSLFAIPKSWRNQKIVRCQISINLSTVSLFNHKLSQAGREEKKTYSDVLIVRALMKSILTSQHPKQHLTSLEVLHSTCDFELWRKLFTSDDLLCCAVSNIDSSLLTTSSKYLKVYNWKSARKCIFMLFYSSSVCSSLFRKHSTRRKLWFQYSAIVARALRSQAKWKKSSRHAALDNKEVCLITDFSLLSFNIDITFFSFFFVFK